MPRILRSFLLQSAAWTALCLGVEAVCRFILHWGYPYNYPAVPPRQIFVDLLYYINHLDNFHSRAFFGMTDKPMYPAPLLLFYKLLYLWPIHIGSHSQRIPVALRFLAVVLATSWIMLACVRRALIRHGLAPRTATLFLSGVYFLSFPFWFEVHQANMEFVVWITVSVGLWAFWTEKPWLAATCFGIATAMKIFPFVFFGLLLVRKQYRQIVFGAAVSAITTVSALWLVCPDIRYSSQQISGLVEEFRQVYMLHLLPMESAFDHSLFALIKRLMPQLPPPNVVSHILSAYMVFVAVAGAALFFLRIRKLPLANQITCLTLAAIFLPPVSYDYTLVHLYVPFFLFVFIAIDWVRAKPGQSLPPGLSLIFALFAFLLSVQSEFNRHDHGVGGQVKAVALIALWIAISIYPLPSSKPEDAEIMAKLNA